MPVTGIPKSLEILLEATLLSATLISWQIYDEKGGVTFKLRFTGVDNGSDSPIASTCYVKKPPAKIKRDKLRSKPHNNEVRITRSKAKQDQIVDKSDIEIVRGLDTTGRSIIPDISHSPVSLHNDLDSSSTEHLNAANLQSPVCSTPLTAMPIDNNQNTTESNTSNQDDKLCSGFDHSDTEDSAHQNKSVTFPVKESEPSVKVDTRTIDCHFLQYGGWRGNHGEKLFKLVCEKCNIVICYDCNMKDKHSEHRPYIKDG